MSNFDLEHFPTSPSALRMMSRISPIYDRSYVGKWIFEVMGVEMDGVRLRYEELRLQAFPETATWGISYWEQKFDISINETLPLETRRKNVIIKRGVRSPMNPARIEQIIGDMCGRQVKVTENVDSYAFQVAICDGDTTVDFDAIFQRLRNLKPSHLAMQVILETGCNVTIQPLPERYIFTARAAGTYPYRNVEGRPIEINIDLAPDAEAHKFTSVPSGKVNAGTIPQRNTEGRAPAAEITSTAAAVGYTFESKLCGMPSRRL